MLLRGMCTSSSNVRSTDNLHLHLLSEVFVIVSLTLFLPICLEQFARDNGFLLPERTIPCSSPSNQAEDAAARCAVKLGWVWIDSASFM